MGNGDRSRQCASVLINGYLGPKIGRGVMLTSEVNFASRAPNYLQVPRCDTN